MYCIPQLLRIIKIFILQTYTCYNLKYQPEKQMEINQTFEPMGSRPGIALNYEAQTYLSSAGKWATFLGILGFILCAFILIAALSFGAVFNKLQQVLPSPQTMILAGMGGAITVFSILIDILYFFFALYLYQFGSNIKNGLTFLDGVHVTAGLGKLKSFFKLWGIVTIIVLVIYILIFGFAIIAGLNAASVMHR